MQTTENELLCGIEEDMTRFDRLSPEETLRLRKLIAIEQKTMGGISPWLFAKRPAARWNHTTSDDA